VRTWATETFAQLSRLRSTSASLIHSSELVQYFEHPPEDLPWWAELLPAAARLAPWECPEGCGGGMRIRTLVIDVPRYMRYLHERAVKELGCRLVEERVERLGGLGADGSLVINCAGLDGGRLAGETGTMVPRAGHTVRISKLREDTPCVLHEIDARELIYVIPRSADCYLGGTDYAGDTSVIPKPEITERIVERCARFVPEVRTAQVLEVRVGVRPGRRDGAVRLDGPVPCDGARVVHCFGHGGAGHTLAWGCAREIVGRVAAAS
jgi:D-amino-acid oxidase